MPGSLLYQPPHPSPTTTPTPVSHWPSILGMGRNSLGNFSHSGKSLVSSTHRAQRPQRATAQPHSLPWDTEVPCPGTGGTSRQSSCSRSVHSACRATRVQGLSAHRSPLAPLSREPPTIPAHPGHQAVPGRAPAPWFEQTRCNHTAQLQQGREELG